MWGFSPGAGGSTFSDWWAYKVEVQDAVPFDGRVLVWADRDTTWRRLREVLAAAEKHDYRSVDFAVAKDPPLPAGY